MEKRIINALKCIAHWCKLQGSWKRIKRGKWKFIWNLIKKNKNEEIKPTNNQSNLRLKRGSRFLLISVTVQWFLFLSEDFGSFLSLVIFFIPFFSSSPALDWAVQAGASMFTYPYFCMLWTALFRDYSSGEGGLAKGTSASPPQVSQHHRCSCAKCLGTCSPSISDGVSVLQDPQCDKTQRNS